MNTYVKTSSLIEESYISLPDKQTEKSHNKVFKACILASNWLSAMSSWPVKKKTVQSKCRTSIQ